MDKWLFAVAAGAGAIVQHFKKHNQTNEQISSESKTDNSFSTKPESPKPPDKKWPFRRPSKSENLKLDDSHFEVLGGGERVRVSENMDELPNKPSTPRSRMSLRSRRTMAQGIRPLTSLESCVMAQLCTDNSSSFVSPSSRPFLVTDGRNVINRASRGSFIEQNSVTEKKLDTNSQDAALLVCVGISFGILCSFMANKREIDRLNHLLKQKENLVQDLEEEMEMKDSLIMREVTIEDSDLDQLTDGIESIGKESVIKKVKDESFSKIEAELEAELEMLELNMTSTLERKISNLVELDPDFEPGIADGELRADMVTNNHHYEMGSTGTLESANYAVSPRDLSLRLHEILQSQLEERIKELKAELESKKTLDNSNSKHWNDFSSSDAGDEKHVDEAVVLNLSGEALDAYNEACNEFAKFDESEEEEFEGSQNGGGTSGNVNDFDEDEMEKLLIKHIVEKTRQGYPVVLNAQRALFSE